MKMHHNTGRVNLYVFLLQLLPFPQPSLACFTSLPRMESLVGRKIEAVQNAERPKGMLHVREWNEGMRGTTNIHGGEKSCNTTINSHHVTPHHSIPGFQNSAARNYFPPPSHHHHHHHSVSPILAPLLCSPPQVLIPPYDRLTTTVTTTTASTPPPTQHQRNYHHHQQTILRKQQLFFFFFLYLFLGGVYMWTACRNRTN